LGKDQGGVLQGFAVLPGKYAFRCQIRGPLSLALTMLSLPQNTEDLSPCLGQKIPEIFPKFEAALTQNIDY